MKKSCVYIEKRDIFTYPAKDTLFHPSKFYPEYPWNNCDISTAANEAYDMVRSSLIGLDLDKEHYGSSDWNPLCDIVHPGDVVLLKPNMVIDKHKNGWDERCLITNPSIVRAMLDYVCIALKGSGKIIVGDAPLQKCDFDALIKRNGYVELIDFIRSKGVNAELKDFRMVTSMQKGNVGFYSIEHKDGDKLGYTAVDLGMKSMLSNIKDQFQLFRVTNYNSSLMKQHHNNIKNEYLVANSILAADVVINLSKPKTHRKAGITAALKNLIGINGSKDWLPHHRKGSIKNKGDEYKNASIFKAVSTNMIERKDVSVINGHKTRAGLLRLTSRILAAFIKVFSKDDFSEGSWYGNDTIWRTICDLNSILQYADKKGNMNEVKQRRIFNVGDMIISGEKEGPLEPSPKNCGIIIASQDSAAFDLAVSRIMGFDYEKIPSICGAFNIQHFPITEINPEEVSVYSNKSEWNNKKALDLKLEDSLHFSPSDGWKNHIEL